MHSGFYITYQVSTHLFNCLPSAQFYASRKRKPLSPVSKPGRNNNDVKNGVEGKSPSAKGTLDNYLATSQGDKNTDKPLSTTHDLLAQRDPVRRNLSSEISCSLKDECKGLSTQSQTDEASEGAQKQKSGELSEVGNGAVGGFTKGNSALLQGVENSELKKFATNFLSLYCRYCNW